MSSCLVQISILKTKERRKGRSFSIPFYNGDRVQSLIGVYFDYKMPRVETTSNTLWHGNMSKLYVFILIVLITLLEMYLSPTLYIDKLPIALTMMNSVILFLIGVVIYMKRCQCDD